MTTKTKTKRGLLVRTDGEMRLVEIDKTRGLKSYYELIGTDIVEVTPATIERWSVEIWCDEEGLYKADNDLNMMVLSLTNRMIVRDVVIHSRSLDKIVALLRVEGCTVEEERG